jgi:hypothetical protein
MASASGYGDPLGLGNMAGATSFGPGVSGIEAGNQYLADQMNQKAPTSPDMSSTVPAGGLQDILKQLQASQNQANAANQQRYKDILGIYSNLGQSGAQQIQQQTQQQQAEQTQKDISSGLSNTTIAGTQARGIASQGQQNLLSLQESLAGKEAGVMESMTQQGPDMGPYLNLIQQMAGQRQGPRQISSPGNFNTGYNPGQSSFFTGTGMGAGAGGGYVPSNVGTGFAGPAGGTAPAGKMWGYSQDEEM